MGGTTLLLPKATGLKLKIMMKLPKLPKMLKILMINLKLNIVQQTSSLTFPIITTNTEKS